MAANAAAEQVRSPTMAANAATEQFRSLTMVAHGHLTMATLCSEVLMDAVA